MKTNDILDYCEDKFYELGFEQIAAEREEAWIKHAVLGLEMSALNIVCRATTMVQKIRKERG